MKIGFIGAGKVGTAFGMYLKDKGHTIVGYYSKTKSSAVYSSRITESKAYDSMARLAKSCDILLITTPDTVIGEVAATLSDLGIDNCGLGHMSGALTTDVFEHQTDKMALFSLHPLQAFASIEKGRQDLETCTFAVEGNETGIEVTKELLRNCENTVVTLKKEQKALYHGAACVTSNYLMVITALAEKMIESFDPDHKVGLAAYKNLMVGALENAIEFGSKKALTGPIARGDVSTVATHLLAMEDRQMKKDYSTLGMMTVLLAEETKLTDPVLRSTFRTLLSSLSKEGVQNNER